MTRLIFGLILFALGCTMSHVCPPTQLVLPWRLLTPVVALIGAFLVWRAQA